MKRSLLPSLLLAGCATAAPGPAPDSDDSPAPDGGGLLVVDLVDGTTLEAARAATGLDLRWVDATSSDESLAEADVDDRDSTQARLQRLPLVEAVEAPIEMSAFDSEALGRLIPSLRYPDDPLYDKQWNLGVVGAPGGWRVGGGRGVTVAVIDTGVTAVADLDASTVLKGLSFVPGTASADDDQGHGTHVAGTISQATHNGVGVAGVAPGARILPMKALSGSGAGMSQWIASAVDDSVDRGAQVINLSLGGPHSAVLHNAVAKAVAAGVIVVAAAGNSSSEGLGCPAHVAGVVAVSATGPDDSLAPYSTWGEGVVLAAPGGDKRVEGGGILQDTIDGAGGHAFREMQGTSMASPHVAGAVAVLLGAGAGPKAVERLIASAQDRGDEGYDTKYGHGRLDLAAAVFDLQVRQNGVLFALAGLLGLGLAWLGAIPQRKTVALAAALTAGGLFFLPLLPVRPFLLVQVLGRPLLDWPALIDVGLAASPIWLSALLPAVLTFVLGPTRTLGPLALGVVAGIGLHLGYGAATGSFDPRWLPQGLATGWLWGNAALCGLCALLILGVQKVRRRGEA